MSFRTKYRKRPRSKRPPDSGSGIKIVIVFILCSALLFAVAVVLGNYLKQVSDGGPYPDAPHVTTEGSEVSEYFNTAEVPVIIGEYRTAEEIINGTGEAATASSGTKNGVAYTATSVLLRCATESSRTLSVTRCQTGMTLSYTSDLAVGAAFDTVGTLNLAKYIGEAKTKYGYVSGIFEVMFFDAADSTESMIREYELSLLVELCECGVDDVVLTGFSEENLAEAVEFVKDLNEKTSGKLKAGIALPFEYYEDDSVRSNIKALQYSCGFLAMDLRDCTVPSLMTHSEFVYDRVSRIASTLSLFSVRVLVGGDTETDYKTLVDSAYRAGSVNIQACTDSLD